MLAVRVGSYTEGMPILASDFVVRWPAGEAAPEGVDGVVSLNEPGWATDGLWPGVRQSAKRGRGRDVEVASASREPWVDANAYLVEYHRALGSPGVLAYGAGDRTDLEVPYDTAELALIEARVAGGNYIVDLPPRFRAGLALQEPKAMAAWRHLVTTAAWLKANRGSMGHPVLPKVTALVEAGPATRELANLLHRRGASPALASAERVPRPSAEILVLVAAGLKQVPALAFAHATGGATVVIDRAAPEEAKLMREEADRGFYSMGRGTVIAYKKKIVDPSEFAMDVIDVVTHKRRATRLWNASAAIPLATMGSRQGEAILHIVNYGSPTTEELQARIQGHYAKATLLRPEAGPQELRASRRGTGTEVFVPSLQRLAIVRFSN